MALLHGAIARLRHRRARTERHAPATQQPPTSTRRAPRPSTHPRRHRGGIIAAATAVAVGVGTYLIAPTAPANADTTITGGDGVSVVLQGGPYIERRLAADPGISFDINDTQLAAGSAYTLSNVPSAWIFRVSGAQQTGTADPLNPGVVTYKITNANVAAGAIFELVPPIKWNGTMPDLTVSRIMPGNNVITDFDNGTFDYIGTAYPQLGTDQTSYNYVNGKPLSPSGYFTRVDVKTYTIKPSSYWGATPSAGGWKDLRSVDHPYTGASRCGVASESGLTDAEKAASGKFLMIDADSSAPPPNNFISVKVALAPNTTYSFSAFLSDLWQSEAWAVTPSAKHPNANFVITLADGTDIPLATTDDMQTTVPCASAFADWTEFHSQFFSGNNTTATLQLRNNGAGGVGNDIGIDNISLRPMGGVSFPITVNERKVAITWSKSVSVSSAAVGDTVVWTVTANNSGTDAATNLSVTDKLPTGLTYVSDDSGGKYNVTSGVWTIGTLAAGGKATLNITTTMQSSSPVTNVATDPKGDDNPTCDNNVCGSATVDPLAPSLSVIKTVANGRAGATAGSAQAGDTLTYTVKATASPNAGYTDANPAVVVDDVSGILDAVGVPTGLAADKGAAPTYDATAKRVVWSGALAKGQTVTLTYTVTVPDVSKRTSNTATNVAFAAASATDATPSTCAAPTCATTTTNLLSPALKVEKTVTNETSGAVGTARPGDYLLYTITVSNTGTAPYTATEPARIHDDLTDLRDDVVVTTPFPTIKSTSSGAAFNETNGIAWSGQLAVGASATITYQVRVNSAGSGDGTLTNIVFQSTSTTPTTPPTCAAPTCATTTTTVGDPKLAVTKSVENNTRPTATLAQAGDRLDYTVTLTNTSTSDFTTAQPAGFVDDFAKVVDDATLLATPALAWSVAGLSQGSDATHAWWTGALKAGASVTLTYSVKVNDVSKQGDKTALNTAFTVNGTATATTPTPTCDAAALSSGACAQTTTNIGGPRLEIGKTVRNVSHSGAPKATVGDQLEFTLTITNAGTADFTISEPGIVRDDLSGVIDDAIFGGTATVSGTGTAGFNSPYLTWKGALAKGDTVTVTYTVTVKSSYAALSDGKSVDNFAFVAATETSTPPASCAAGDKTCAQTQTPIGAPALTITKSVVNTTSAAHSPAWAGDVLEYTVTAVNSGDVAFTDANLATVIDDITAVLDDTTLTSPPVAVTSPTAGVGSLKSASPKIVWQGALGIGEQVVITYQVTVKDYAKQGDHTAHNTAFAAATTTDTTPGTCTAPSCAQTSTDLGAPALLVTKAVENTTRPSAAKAQGGDTLKYTITIKNTGTSPYTTSAKAVVVDDLTKVIDDATYQNDAAIAPASADDTVGFTSPKVSWSGPLDPDATKVLTYTVVVKEATRQGDKEAVNVAFAGASTSDNPPATCAAPTCDSTETEIGTPVLEVSKTVENTTSPGAATAQAGDVLTYTITASNTGDAAFTAAEPARVIDDLTGALLSGTYGRDAAASEGEVTYTEPKLTWTAALAGGTSATITYTVVVNDTAEQQAKNVVNIAFVAASPLTPTPSACPVASTTCASTTTPLGTPQLAVAKEVENTTNPRAAKAQAGDVLRFTLTITNYGDATFTDKTPAIVVDNLAMAADDATYGEDAAVSPAVGTVAVSASVLTWSGPLAAKAQVEVTYTMEVKEVSQQGDKKIDNYAIAATSTTVTPPTTCANLPAGSCGETHTTVGGPAITVTKSVTNTTNPDGAKAQAGDTLEYTVTVTNTGDADYTAAEPARVVDDLTQVLDDAIYQDDAAADVGDVSYHAPRLVWSGALKKAEVATITLTVKVKDFLEQGDRSVDNIAFAARTPADTTPTCPAGSTTCGTTHTDLGGPQLGVTKAVENLTTAGAAVAQAGDKLKYTLTLTNTGDAAYTATEPARLVDDLTAVLDDGTYDAASPVACSPGTCTFTSPKIYWNGVLGVGDHAQITYVVVVKDTAAQGDKHLVNVAFAATRDSDPTPTCQPTATTCATTDTPTGTPKLAVTKTVANTTRPGAAYAQAGDQLTFTLSVTNSGTARTTVSDPAIVVDDLTGVLDDATWDDTLAGDGVSSYSAPKVTWKTALDVDETATLQYSVTVKEISAQGDKKATNIAFLTPDPATPTPASCDPATPDQCGSTTTDVGTPATAITKVVENVTRPSAAKAQGGDTLKYTITVKNTGTAAFTATEPAIVSDNMSAALDDVTFDASTVAAPEGTTVSWASPVLTWKVPLAAGATQVLTYTVVVKDQSGLGDHRVGNVAYEGLIVPECEHGKDPACTQTPVGTPASKVVKTVSNVTHPKATVADVGDVLEYTLTLTNTGDAGYTATEPAIVIDDLSAVVDDAVLELSTYTSSAGTLDWNAATARLTWTTALNAGASATATYRVTVKEEAAQGDKSAENVAFAATTPTDPTPTCDPAATDCAATVTPLGGARLTVTKEVDNTTRPGATVAQAGDTLAYTITATNKGDASFTADNPAVVVDDLTGVLDDATYNKDATATLTPTRATVPAPNYTEPKMSWQGELAPAQVVVITYTVTVKDVEHRGDSVATNIAFAARTPGDDTPQQCQPTAESCGSTSTDVGKPGLALTKSVVNTTRKDAAAAQAGDTLTYTITATNTGTANYTATEPAHVVDDLAGVLDDATYNNDAAASLDPAGASAAPAPSFATATATATSRLSWSGALRAGQRVTLTYSVTVKENALQGDKHAANVVFEPAKNGDKPDCTTDPGLCPGTDTEVGTPGLTLDKQVANTTHPGAPGRTGDVLTFTLTAANTGDADYTAAEPARLTDTLADVLDDASYNGDAAADTGTVAVADAALTWTGVLRQGERVTITYSVTVKPQAERGNATVHNVAFDPDRPDTPPVPAGPDPVCPTGRADCAETVTPTGDPVVSIQKSVTNTTRSGATVAQESDVLKYAVVITNDTPDDYTAANPAVAIDDLTGVLTVADYNNDGSSGAGVVNYSEPRLTWTGPLPAGASVTMTYTVTVRAASDRQGHSATNLAFSAVTPQDPTPQTCPATDTTCDTTTTDTGEPGLSVIKYVETAPDSGSWITASDGAASYSAGQSARFRVVVTNTGTTSQSNIVVEDPAVPTCSGTLLRLDPGQQATLSCTWHVTGALTNVATATSSDGTTGHSSATVALRSPSILPNTTALPFTGVQIMSAALVAGGLLTLGLILVITRRRKAVEHVTG